jgi:RNA polymerase sigma-70 factor (ECF subfamily)
MIQLTAARRDVARTTSNERSTEVRRELTRLLPILTARAMRLCRSSSEAEDVVSDTIVRALEFEAGYQPGTNLRAWMNQVLFSVFVTRCRRLRRERRALDALASDPCAWTRSDGTPAMQSLTVRVRTAIDALPAQFAAVVELVDLGELSYKDAAEHLGVPVGTVMSRLFRGRRMLANALADSIQPVQPILAAPAKTMDSTERQAA